MQKIYGLSTARAGSRCPPAKNLLTIKGKPLYLHNLLESLDTPEIKETYITTDILEVQADSEQYGFHVIRAPDEMYGENVHHTDVIHYAMLEIEKRIKEKVDILVVMLGNTVNMDKNVVKEAIDILNKEPEVESVITVIKANHFNPLRAYKDDGTNHITTFLDQDLIKKYTSQKHLSDKNTMGDILFQNGLWIVRRQTVINAKEHNIGLQPFPWFGNKIRYITQEPHLQEIDDMYQIRLLQ